VKSPAPANKKNPARTFDDIRWLNDVREVRHPLDSSHPIFVREFDVILENPKPQPTVPHPERHPYCELTITLEGEITQFIGAEKEEKKTGDVMLLGPDTPHYAYQHSRRHRALTIYFLPLVFFELGPNGDGVGILSRFTAPQTISQRIISPPATLRRRIEQNAKAVSQEWKSQTFGSEVKLWLLLFDCLVELLRWERAQGRLIGGQTAVHDWAHVEKALRYIHEHSAKPLYIEEIAAQVGITTNRLRSMFRHALGTTCSHYLYSLRIARAKILLCQPDAVITHVAQEVGFESLSHFNTSFRKEVGVSPTEYSRGVLEHRSTPARKK
jgi:AraC-like DNA-binding protein